MKFKRRKGEVEEVLVTHNFDYAWERSTSSMNPETAWMTQVGRTFAFFAANVASECERLPNGGQWVVVEFNFQSGQ